MFSKYFTFCYAIATWCIFNTMLDSKYIIQTSDTKWTLY